MSAAIVIEAGIWPPSVNGTWRSEGGRNILSAKARTFRAAMQSVIAAGRAKKLLPRRSIEGPVAVSMTLFPPDRKRRDLDNYQKGVFDALTKARFWLDDSQVRRMSVEFGEPVRGGALRIEVTELDGGR